LDDLGGKFAGGVQSKGDRKFFGLLRARGADPDLRKGRRRGQRGHGC